MAKSELRELREARAGARQTAGIELLARLKEAGGGLLDLPDGIDFGPRLANPDGWGDDDPQFVELAPWPTGELMRSECTMADLLALSFDPRDSSTALGVLAWCPDASAAEAAVEEAVESCARAERENAVRAAAAGYKGWNVKFTGRVVEAGVVDLSFVAAHRVVTVRRGRPRPDGLSAAESDLAMRALLAEPDALALKMRSASGAARHASWYDLLAERRRGASIADALVLVWDVPPEVRLAAARKERPRMSHGEFMIGKWECTYMY